MNTRVNDSGEDDEFVMSPSETVAHNAAMRVAGVGKTDSEHRTQRALASITLGFELIIVVLIGLAIFGLNLLDPRELGLYLGGGLALACILALIFMRVGNVGIYLGHLVHVAMLSTALILPAAGLVALLFTGLWVFCLIKGRQIDRQRGEWQSAQTER